MKIQPLTKEQRAALLVSLVAAHMDSVRAGMSPAHMPPFELFTRIEAEINTPSLSLADDVRLVFDSLGRSVSIKEGNPQKGGKNEND